MQRKLEKGEAIDISAFPKVQGGDYLLRDFTDGVDYCDANAEQWIWSIGRPLKKMAVQGSDNVVWILDQNDYLASQSNRYYQNPDFECVWLR